jgi:hypothetical protein
MTNAAWWSDPNIWVAAASLGTSIAALVVSNTALKNSDQNSSGATFVSLYDGLRQGWIAVRKAEPGDDQDYQFSELMNSFEIASAIYVERAIHGAFKEMLGEYLCHTLTEIGANDYARDRISKTRDSANTYKNIRAFQVQMKKAGQLKPIQEIL